MQRDYVPEANWNRNTGRLPGQGSQKIVVHCDEHAQNSSKGRYKDADYEKWSRNHGIQRKETIREKVNTKGPKRQSRIRRSKSIVQQLVPREAYEFVDVY